jgi:CheY-like chemotaxis protein
MESPKYPFAVRLIGFEPLERIIIEQIFSSHAENRHSYFCLQEDNLHDPDIFLANGNVEKALVALSYLGPSTLRPALLVSESMNAAYPHVSWPIKPHQLISALNTLVEKRASALSMLEASDIVTVPERRRRDRSLDEKLSPEDYVRLRRPQVNGAILMVDKHASSRDLVAEMLARRPIPVVHADTEAGAVDQCRRQKVSIVLVNTSIPGIDCYRLCAMVKRQIADRITVVFLVRNSSEYDQNRARNAGCDGYLEKPLSNKNLLSAIKKFHPAFWH